ncbi:MAG: transcriptional repressor NrdR [Firmicutes bacterium]|nr:transcriptional repressor NrdR [Bacillota bacterium]
MKCPFCQADDSRVVDSRPIQDGQAIRRRRECVFCSRRFTTFEEVEQAVMMVVKRDGRRQEFDRNKIMNGLVRACEKRPIPVEVLQKIATDVELEMRNNLKAEIESKDIGEAIMRRLRELDTVAYIRFASVYRDFEDLDHFMNELKKIREEENDP